MLLLDPKAFIICDVEEEEIDLKDLVTPDEAAELMGIKRRSVYQYRRTGRIRGVYFGRALMVSRKSVGEWLESQRVKQKNRERREAKRKAAK